MLIPVLLLTCLGIAVIFSFSPVLAIQQAIYALFGLALFVGLSITDYRSLRSLIKLSYVIILILLLIVLFLGFETRGSIRWIPLGIFNFQPSEFAKVVLVFSLANFWSRNLPSWKNIFLSGLIFLPIALLVFRQPDLGTTLTLGCIWLAMLVGSNVPLSKIIVFNVLGLCSLPLGWFLLKDYQKLRVMSFLYPTHDPLGTGYNVIQSTIAVGSGMLWGRGLGRGTQSRLQFLPEFKTDFIFASLAEELGMIGVFIVLFLYSSILFFLFRYLARVEDRFGELIIVGILSMLIFQVVVNIGMNIGLLPVTGITLPLLSYGGSSVITTYICLGAVSSVRAYGLRPQRINRFGISEEMYDN